MTSAGVWSAAGSVSLTEAEVAAARPFLEEATENGATQTLDGRGRTWTFRLYDVPPIDVSRLARALQVVLPNAPGVTPRGYANAARDIADAYRQDKA